MLTKGKMGLGMAFGILCLAITSAGVLEAMRLEDRDLTDAEMGAIFGKQPGPNPNPLCNGCKELIMRTPDCVGNDPCLKCFQGSGSCASNSFHYSNNQYGSRVESDSSNDHVMVYQTSDCWIKYHCVAGNAIPNRDCLSSGCSTLFNPVAPPCTPCSRGESIGNPHTAPDKWCDTCPGDS